MLSVYLPFRMSSSRIEKDSMGTMEVPADALYGASTQRAVLNFPVSGHGFGRELIRALGMIKWAAAEANFELGRLDEARTTLIAKAAHEVIDGKHDAHFPVDIYQTGSGTSTNMNINEVLANRCSQLAGKPLGSKEPVHPNDQRHHPHHHPRGRRRALAEIRPARTRKASFRV
jgi:fumarate hydratase class II